MRRLIIRYLAGFAAGWLLIGIGLYALKTAGPASTSGSLLQKMEAWEQDPARYDLVFIGDSRTYCAMHPDQLDPLLGTRSLNLAHWAHWMPTQLAQFQDLLEVMPEGVTIVWSVGHQNFRSGNRPIHPSYPIGVSAIPRYLSLGYSLGSMKDNLVFFNPATTVLGWMPQIRQRLDRDLDRAILDHGPPASSSPSRPESLPDLLTRLRGDPVTDSIEILSDGGQVTSVEVLKDNGAYERVELDPGYFRARQRENAREVERRLKEKPDRFEATPQDWATFLAILDLCREKDARLIVNEVEEAPYIYLSAERRESWRRFMRETVEREVVSRGIPYVRVDFDLMSDEDYFDFNHLNRDGIRKYSRLLAERLGPLLQRSGEAP